MKYLDLVIGKYPQSNTDLPADVLVGNSFGTATGPGSVNAQLAEYVESRADGRPIIADTMLAKLIKHADVQEVKGDISNLTGGNVGSWGIVIEAHRFMAENKLEVAKQVGHRYHLGRIAAQAYKADILFNVFPEEEEMPSHFDKDSDQIWTRNRGLWMAREALGVLVLKHKGML